MGIRIARLASSFSLVAEIGWLASDWPKGSDCALDRFQSRCRDWVVGENAST